MGQKVNPIGFRLGSTFQWKSRWFAGKGDYSDQVLEDHKLRSYMQDKLSNAGLVQIDIERSLTTIKITLHVSRPGVVIGRGGSNLQEVREEIERILTLGRGQDDKKKKVDIKVEEITKPELSAKLIAERIAQQLAGRYPHRRAVSQALEKVMGAGAEGVKIQLKGRIGGSEIGRTEKYSRGSVPTQTIRAYIDYFHAPAHTKSGYVGIKVWINRGEIFTEKKKQQAGVKLAS
jgi:small subunit ribosomal protein S3